MFLSSRIDKHIRRQIFFMAAQTKIYATFSTIESRSKQDAAVKDSEIYNPRVLQSFYTYRHCYCKFSPNHAAPFSLRLALKGTEFKATAPFPRMWTVGLLNGQEVHVSYCTITLKTFGLSSAVIPIC